MIEWATGIAHKKSSLDRFASLFVASTVSLGLYSAAAAQEKVACGLSRPDSITLDGDYVYFGELTSSDGYLSRAPKNPTANCASATQRLVLGAALPEGGSLVGMVRISFSPTHVYFGFGSYTSGKIDEVLRDGTLRRTVVQPAGGRLIGLLPENLYFFEGFSLLELISTIPGAVKQPLDSGVFPRSSVEDGSSLFFALDGFGEGSPASCGVLA